MGEHMKTSPTVTWLVLIGGLALLGWTITRPGLAAPVHQAIKVDHFGYRPGDPKVAVFSANPGPTVEVRSAADTVVMRVPGDGGSIVGKGADGASGDTVWWVDFSLLAAPGTYRIYSPALAAQSYDFDIRDDIYDAPLRAALKTFYYQRCSTPKLSAHAGAWADNQACHLTDAAARPAAGHTDYGTLDLRGGHHDAGDYNKYVWRAVSSAMLFLLRAYEDNPGVFADGDGNIPESSNGVPDLLDEVKWELDWLLKMQLPNGAVLSRLQADGFDSNSPPSADTGVRSYQNPTMESGAVLAGTLAHASRVFDAAGQAAYAQTLKTSAIRAWQWLSTQSDNDAVDVREVKVWAAAEVWRLDSSVTSARAYVDGFYASSWAGRFLNVARYDTNAALSYLQAPGATPEVVANMRASVANQVDYIFAVDDLYRNGMPDWAYHWGSNGPRAAQGVFLLTAGRLGLTGSHTAVECAKHAMDILHFFHGQNALNMVYLTNMAALGGEHSSFQMFHLWFGDTRRAYSRATFLGKPAGIIEPDYPYFAGVDNLGISDNKTSTLGPPPGFVPGGPNASYGGTAVPPGNAGALNRYYRDWADQTVLSAQTWEITENSIGYQGPYVALASYFAPRSGPGTNLPSAPTNLQIRRPGGD
jgi:hypothetical protein